MKYKLKYLKPLFEAIKSGATIDEACEMARITRLTFFNWVKLKDGFSAKVDELMEPRAKIVKEVAYKKAIDGNSDMIKYWLDKMSDWKEVSKHVHTGEVTMKSVTDFVERAEKGRMGELAEASEN